MSSTIRISTGVIPGKKKPEITYGGNVPGIGASPSGDSPPYLNFLPENVANVVAGGTQRPYIPQEVIEAEHKGAKDDVMSYDQYTENQKNIKDSVHKYADITYEDAMKRAAAQHERAIVDADTSYQKHISDYGANAERLAGMGLSSSGYADYFKSQAYAQKRDDIQAAGAIKYAAEENAASVRDKTKLDADITYEQAMANKALSDEQSRETAYLKLLEGAGNGTYSSEMLSSLGAQYGLSEEQISNLKSIRTEFDDASAESKKDSQINALMDLAIEGASPENLTQIAKSWGITDASIAPALQIALNNKAEKKKADIEAFVKQAYDITTEADLDRMIRNATASGFTETDIAKAIEIAQNNINNPGIAVQQEKFIDKQELKKYVPTAIDYEDAQAYGYSLGLSDSEIEETYQEAIDSIVTDKLFSDAKYGDAKSAYDDIVNDPKVLESTKERLTELYNAYLKWYFSGEVRSSVGNVTPWYGMNIKINDYKCEIGSQVEGSVANGINEEYSAVFGKDKTPSAGDVFIYQGKIYIWMLTGEYDDNRNVVYDWFKIQRRKLDKNVERFEPLCTSLGIDTYNERN